MKPYIAKQSKKPCTLSNTLVLVKTHRIFIDAPINLMDLFAQGILNAHNNHLFDKQGREIKPLSFIVVDATVEYSVLTYEDFHKNFNKMKHYRMRDTLDDRVYKLVDTYGFHCAHSNIEPVFKLEIPDETGNDTFTLAYLTVIDSILISHNHSGLTREQAGNACENNHVLDEVMNQLANDGYKFFFISK